MIDARRIILKVISILLQYPDGSLASSLDSVDEVMRECSEIEAMESLAPLMSYLRETPLLQLQEKYTRSFDLDPRMCLNITYHRWGDERERGNALARLNEVYKSAGYEALTTELPDYLPLMLEFFSICSPNVCSRIVDEYRPQIEALGSRLKEAGSPYSALFEVVADTLGS